MKTDTSASAAMPENPALPDQSPRSDFDVGAHGAPDEGRALPRSDPFEAPPESWRPACSAWSAAYSAAVTEFATSRPWSDPATRTGPEFDFTQTQLFARMVKSATKSLEPSLPLHVAELARAAAILAWFEMHRIAALEHDLGLPPEDFENCGECDDPMPEPAADFMPSPSHEPWRPLGEAVEMAFARAREQCARDIPMELLQIFRTNIKEVAIYRGKQVAFDVLRAVLSRDGAVSIADSLARAAWNAHERTPNASHDERSPP